MMPRIISQEAKNQAIKLIKDGKYTQVEIHNITGLSRPYIKKLANSVGVSFKRKSKVRRVQCEECKRFFEKYKLTQDTKHFCSMDCFLEFKNAK